MPLRSSAAAPLFVNSMYSKSCGSVISPAGGGAGLYINSEMRSAPASKVKRADSAPLHVAPLRTRAVTVPVAVIGTEVPVYWMAFGLRVPSKRRGSDPSRVYQMVPVLLGLRMVSRNPVVTI